MGNSIDANLNKSAFEAYVMKDYYKAFSEFSKLGSYPDALCMLGDMLCEGLGCDVNKEEGYGKYVKAYELGSPTAAYKIGMMFLKGVVVKPDFKEAYKYLKEAHEKKYSVASLELGKMLRIGYEIDNENKIEKNPLEATMYLESAAKENNADAAFVLGIMTYFGEAKYMDCSTEKAISYLELAAKQNHMEAKYQLGVIHLGNDFLDYKKAYCYFDDSKELKRSCYHLGYLLLYGLGVEKDEMKAIEYLIKAEDADSYELLGDIYSNHVRTEINVQNSADALKYYLLAYNQNNKCVAKLGLLYYNQYRNTHSQEAKKYLEEGLNQGHIEVCKVLYVIYCKNPNKDSVKAQECLTILENTNDPLLLNFVGKVYLGMKNKKMNKKGYDCYLRSAELGNKDAMNKVQMLCYTGIGYMMQKDIVRSFEWAVKFINSLNYYSDNNMISMRKLYVRQPSVINQLYDFYTYAYNNKKISQTLYNKLLKSFPKDYLVDKIINNC